MPSIGSYHIYVTPDQVFEATKIYHHHNHYLAARFEHEHKVRVTDITKFRYYQNKDNRTGQLVLEVEIDAKLTEPVKGKIWKPLET